MARNLQRKELIRVSGIRACYGSDRLMSVVHKFTSTHIPLLAYRDDGAFEGVLTVDATLQAPKHNPSALVRTFLLTPPEITNDVSPIEALRLMRDLRLYTLPIVDNKQKVIGLLRAKILLKKLLQNPHLALRLTEALPVKTVITISESESVGHAFQLFAKHKISRLICVDKNNKVKGVVTKRDIALAFLSSSSRQRFSTRSSYKNYSFDVEQIKRNKNGLAPYMTPISNVAREGMDTLSIIHSILDHKYNSMVTVDASGRPQAIYSMRTILDTALKLISRAPYLLAIISKLPNELGVMEKEIVLKSILKTASWIHKQHPVTLIHMSNNVVRSKEHRVILFEVRLTIKTDSTYYAKHKNRDFVLATKGALREIKKQIFRSGKMKRHPKSLDGY